MHSFWWALVSDDLGTVEVFILYCILYNCEFHCIVLYNTYPWISLTVLISHNLVTTYCYLLLCLGSGETGKGYGELSEGHKLEQVILNYA